MAAGAPPTRFRLLALVLLIVGAGGGGWFAMRAWLASRDVSLAHPNVLLISIDTCRPDYLSCYGYARRTTPHLDALARDGVLFRNAITPVPITLPAHCSLLTGTLPPYHGVHANISYRLRESNVTLAEVLKENGYATGGVVGAYMMDAKFGLGQGFDFYDANFKSDKGVAGVLNARVADDVNRVATAWLKQHADQRFFLFLHYYDPHHPYQPPEPFASNFADNAYAGEIAYVDHCIGRIVAELKALGLYDSTLIIVTADHGEALGEHGEASHGYFVYHSTTKVPLIVKPAGHRGSRVVDDKVSLVDIFPTVLEQVGVSLPADAHGESLSAYLTGASRTKRSRYLFSESLMPTLFGCSSLLALETDRWKYIQTTRPELYDLQNDPKELTNVVTRHPQAARELRDRLRALLAERTRLREGDARVALDSRSVERLESLGYVGGRTQESFEFETSREDPKDFLPFFEKLTRAQFLIRREPRSTLRVQRPDGQWESVTRYELARRICEEVLAERPDVAKAHAVAGRASYGLGDLAGADVHYTALARLQPDSPEAQNDLGYLRGKQGRLDEAVALHRKALALLSSAAGESPGGFEGAPPSGVAAPGRNGKGDSGGRNENVDRATDDNVDRALTRLGRVDPVAVVARFNLADVLFRQGKIAEAAGEYRIALRLRPRDAKAHYVIGLDLAKRGRYADARKSYRTALEINPDYAAAREALNAVLQAEARLGSR